MPASAPPRPQHVARALAVLDEIQRGHAPADQILDGLFRRHREMGKRDRASVSGLVYGVLRDLQRLRTLGGEAPALWLSRALADAGFDPLAAGLPAAPAARAVDGAAALNLPADWYARLIAQHGADGTAALAAALNGEASVDLRANRLKITRDQLLARLRSEGHAATSTPYAPDGLRLDKRLPRGAPVLEEGLAEPQDEGSQLLALLVDAAPGSTVIDYCAGAGGKTLALAAAMHNHGRLIACDVSASRLARLAPRLQRAGVGIVETCTLAAEHDDALDALRADAVLIDAPCSGTGTLRRAPELRLRSLDLPSLAAVQWQLLCRAARRIRPGGQLVYATCSLFAEENHEPVAAFLKEHPDFAPDKDAAVRVPALSGLVNALGELRLLPHRHGTDGFYAAALRRAPGP